MALIMLIFLMAMFLCNATSFAANWHEYFQANDNVRSYIDLKSIVRLPEGKVRAWEKRISSNSSYGYLTLTEIDCKKNMYTIKALEPLDPNDAKAKKGFEAVMKNWKEPVQVWEQLGTSDLEKAQFNHWCGKNITDH